MCPWTHAPAPPNPFQAAEVGSQNSFALEPRYSPGSTRYVSSLASLSQGVPLRFGLVESLDLLVHLF